MTDVVSPKKRSEMMSGIRGKNTKPELIVRQELHRRGFRYRLHHKGLPGKPDLVFPKYKTVIFVNGCFWHGHNCKLFKWPKSNPQFWKEKISGNQVRDEKQRKALEEGGWQVITVWECSLKGKSPHDIMAEIDSISERLTQNG
ncbi:MULTISPECIES: very short patch repair endonuclease [Spongiibacteraceae]|uniref:Very short patch repair endonuclease n=1 Tax=Zhongshania aliphaticivorans TaxID=1470434 RepID=A0A127M287_9GAMM|nr:MULTISPECIES: very short patch repair endonuclease [Spongiibacteraceae]AMO67334.1 very short patch repair endonuclease [Zhongshania aliphaticivorans]MBM7422309.1 DNA mismatch endonuclease (patch repair protein) [Spongiibacter marinus]